MHMKKCEKGSIANTRNFKSLTGRWFGEEKKEKICEQGIILEQGAVIRLTGNKNIPYFVIFVVWCNNGSKKWFPLLPEENSAWPLTQKESKQYCVGV